MKSTYCKLILSGLVIGALLPAALSHAQVTTTIQQILAERDTTTTDRQKIRYCNGGIFKPCVCWQHATKRVMYRPKVRECGGKAAIILSSNPNGSYVNAFSAVLRNVENADRIPDPRIETVGGCTKELASSESPPNRCSVFKAQKVIRAGDDRGDIKVHCLGAAGNSRFGKMARRITIKLADSPNDSNDPIVRVCLQSPLKNLN